MKEAMLYEKLYNNAVHCFLCSHNCQISEGKFGICGVRKNSKGTLYTLSYGKLVACNIDPIEKKPIFHLLPGSGSLSIATVGCNFRCSFCQNWQISQMRKGVKDELPGDELSHEEIVEIAISKSLKSISYTYTEPTIFFEYAYETAKLAKSKGLFNIFVTNGFMTPETLKLSPGVIDAANVDLKSFREEYYKNVCGARLAPVLESIKLMRKLGIWVEVTTLIVPGKNDSKEELSDIAEFLASVDKSMPWHISRFHPDYNMADIPATPVKTLEMARSLGIEKGLKYVYVGNFFGQAWENTLCYKCGKLLIEREGFTILQNKVVDSKCPDCSAVIDGVML